MPNNAVTGVGRALRRSERYKQDYEEFEKKYGSAMGRKDGCPTEGVELVPLGKAPA
jgi:hypothetical protein